MQSINVKSSVVIAKHQLHVLNAEVLQIKWHRHEYVANIVTLTNGSQRANNHLWNMTVAIGVEELDRS